MKIKYTDNEQDMITLQEVHNIFGADTTQAIETLQENGGIFFATEAVIGFKKIVIEY